MSFLKFPEGFVWGAITAACRIGAACTEDGEGFSIWDTFVRQSGQRFLEACRRSIRAEALAEARALQAERVSLV